MSKQEQKHTPGPWKVERDDFDETFYVVQAGSTKKGYGYTIETVICRDISAKANARLIAAAPELLKALESAATTAHYRDERNFCRGSFDECSNVACRGWRELIAKAKGGEQ